MQIDVPSFISEMPTKEYWKSVYPKNRNQARIAFLVATRVYWRTVISERQNHRCCYCGVRTTTVQGLNHSATVDHIVPSSCGGADNPENYAIACYKCNNKRGNTPYEKFIEEQKQQANLEQIKKQMRLKIIEADITLVNRHSLNRLSVGKLQRKLDAAEVKKLILAGQPNTYEEGTRKYKMYLRFTSCNAEVEYMKEAA